MTRKLSRREPTVESSYPDVCPKCGSAIGPRPFDDVRAHFERTHSKSIGTAYRADNATAQFDFAYVSPVHGTTERRWWIAAFSWPYGLVTIKVDEWIIRWHAGTAPAAEGVLG